MTISEKLVYCKKCTNRKHDFQVGVVCGLTGEKPQFETECENYKFDSVAAVKVAQKEREKEILSGTVSGGIRFANYIIDRIIFTILVIVAAVILAFAGMDDILESRGGLYLLTIVVVTAYFVFFEGLFGQSIGKMFTGTMVVTDKAGKPSFGQLLGRSLCRFIPFEAFSFLGSNPGWHDSLSGTRVIKKLKKPVTDSTVIDDFGASVA